MSYGRAGSDRRGVAGIPPKVSRVPGAQATCRPAVRALIPPLTIIAALVTAVALLLTAAAIAPPPLTGAIAPLPARSTGAMPLAPGSRHRRLRTPGRRHHGAGAQRDIDLPASRPLSPWLG